MPPCPCVAADRAAVEPIGYVRFTLEDVILLPKLAVVELKFSLLKQEDSNGYEQSSQESIVQDSGFHRG